MSGNLQAHRREQTEVPVSSSIQTVEAFGRLVALPDSQLDLARAALLAAAVYNADLDVEAYLHELELMAEGVAQRAAPATDSAGTLKSLIRYLFDELGFRGNKSEYEDPRNSYLNEVLDRRVGIPITLSLLCIELGRRNGLLLDGVGYPGHFLVRWLRDGHEPVFLDAFDRGRVVSEEALLRALAAGGMAAERSQSLLMAVTKRQILSRMLMNLKRAFGQRELAEEALQASELVLVISPWDLDERRDHGMLALA